VRFLVVSDLVALGVAMAAGLAVAESFASWRSIVWAGATALAALATFAFLRLYERDWQHISVSSADEVRDFVNALTLIGFAELALGEALSIGQAGLNRTAVILFWVIGNGALPLVRVTFRHLVIPALNNPQNTVIVGAGTVGQRIAQKIRRHPEHNIRLIGFLDDQPQPLDPLLVDLPILGGEADLVSTIRNHGVTRVILAFSRRSAEEVLEVVRIAGLKDLHLSIVPRYFEIVGANVGVGDVEGIPVLEVPPGGLSRLARFTKRAMDIVLTIPGLVLLSPLLLAIAVAIKLDSPRPVFYRQPRMGRGHRLFRIFKFRTMVADAEELRSQYLQANEASGPLF
jgi:FlaA1/EpsC-like NDP-sugar epimerase